MGRFFKKVSLFFLIIALAGTALFSKEILLKCVAWKAAAYCREAFGAELSFDSLIWEGGKIVFKNGGLQKKGELQASFAEASLLPFFDWKGRTFGGELKLQQLKIVHQKKEPRPVPTPPPPSFKLMTLHLDTVVEGGEIYLYDCLAENQFFQHARFDLTHHICGERTCGSISFEWDPHSPKFVTHFSTESDARLALTAHFQSHSFPILSHLITYFFQSYLPEPAFQWDILKGTLDGDLTMSLVHGAPIKMKGKIELNGIYGENSPLAISAEFDHLGCDLDIDFSHVSTINGQFDLKGGQLSLQQKGDFWRGMWDLKNLHSQICIKEGKVDSSSLKGNFMGMEGELVLDWQAHDALMKMEFMGESKEICPFLPESMRKGFASAFPNDLFIVDASLDRSEEGLELAGSLSVTDQHAASFYLFFGCLLNRGERGLECDRAYRNAWIFHSPTLSIHFSNVSSSNSVSPKNGVAGSAENSSLWKNF